MRRTLRVLVAVGVATLLLAAAVGAGAEGAEEPRVSPVLGPDLRISGPNATAFEAYPAVAWNQTANQYLVVWEDGRNDSTGWDIYGRRVGASGARIGGDVRISGVNATANEYYPAVAWNQTANQYLVVWQDDRNLSSRHWDIYGRRVGAGGAGIGEDFLISGVNATSNEYYPAVAWNQAANEYLVVWQDERNYLTRGSDIYGRRVSAGGAAIGGDFRISGDNATSLEGVPAVAWNQAASEYLVVWTDGRNYSTRASDVYGRRVGAGGAAIGDDFRISGSNATANDYFPAVAWNQTANQYLVVWQDERSLSTRGSDIYGRRVGAGGAAIGGDFRISGSNATSDDDWPAVTWNQTANQYLVVWEDGRNYSTRYSDIYGRRVTG